MLKLVHHPKQRPIKERQNLNKGQNSTGGHLQAAMQHQQLQPKDKQIAPLEPEPAIKCLFSDDSKVATSCQLMNVLLALTNGLFTSAHATFYVMKVRNMAPYFARNHSILGEFELGLVFWVIHVTAAFDERVESLLLCRAASLLTGRNL
uniref:Uncharacterized protein n=1 Tax=Rhizophora mucronata TaxID=61149 RepID=A0A2P2M0T6_RHIMU